MDDLAHQPTLNHRKRKADSDDRTSPDPPDPLLPPDVLSGDSSAVSPNRPSPVAPRLPWLTSNSPMWSSPISPSSCSPVSPQDAYDTYPANPPKRPRLDISDSPPPSPAESSSKKPIQDLPKSLPSRPHPADLAISRGSATGPGSPLTSHSLHQGAHTGALFSSAVPFIPPSIDSSSAHIPSLKPPINKQTLRELELESILRNPQLRHDLLFEPGIQFRPTYSRRKREAAEKYWAALTQELEDGCTCISFSITGKPRCRICACGQIPPPSYTPVTAYSPAIGTYTVRMPSRIRTFLHEFLEVLLLVIQPLSDTSCVTVNVNSSSPNLHEQTAQAKYIRSIFDPELIEQEIRCNVFDPSGWLEAIGHTLKDHCAPMRDSAVDEMVQVAKSCASGSKYDAVRAVRMCMELLEVMKLDIANHQLQSLRPYLTRTSGQYELKTFQNRKWSEGRLSRTRQWLRAIRNQLLAHDQEIVISRCTSGTLTYSKLSMNQQIYFATLTGLVELVFMPPTEPASSTNETSALSTRSDGYSLSIYPETLYLDTNRLLILSSEVSEITTLHMCLLLYRQLIHAIPEHAFSGSRQSCLDQTSLQRLKKEARDVAGNRLGCCFSCKCLTKRHDAHENGADMWSETREGIVLQVVKHVCDAQNSSEMQEHVLNHTRVPDGRTLGLAQKWAATNLQPSSSLHHLVRERLRTLILDAVISAAYPGNSPNEHKLTDLALQQTLLFPHMSSFKAAGMEPLMDEIRVLVQKITRLALIHLNTYLPLYEQTGFLAS
ncbi:hypothetical protein AMATHDRAFT_136052 [Amanita thiersii Skay4041]|uniref:Uncharacterized protein n=1 Tax=Amanita thiersii Skay4041 TaxID=703135 RepID=A0A2A9NZH0_9AGAR|nr:hypothetical protein AMATHDRAFT_136052 [Amanita thiersii Skay4041]